MNTTEKILTWLNDYEMGFKNQISKKNQVVSIELVSGTTWKVNLKTNPTGLTAGHYIYIDSGSNEGYHLIDSVGANFVTYIDSSSVATGGIGTVYFYQISSFRIARSLASQQALISKITGFSFSGIDTFTEYHDGNGTQELMLDRRPVIAVTALAVLSIPQTLFSVPISTIEVVSGQGLLRIRAINSDSYSLVYPMFPKGTNNIKVTYTAGFASLPEELERALIFMTVAFLLGQEAALCGGGVSLSVVAYSKSYNKRGKWAEYRDDLVSQARAILRKYQTGVVGT